MNSTGLYAENAVIKGLITSVSTLEDGTRVSSGFWSSSESRSSLVPSRKDIVLWAGGTGPRLINGIENAPFRVDSKGNLVATSATIKGAIISEDNGTTSGIDTNNENYIFWGGAENGDIDNASFKVSKSGVLYASGAIIEGTIRASRGFLGEINISTDGLSY
jgi:hypothetical protein